VLAGVDMSVAVVYYSKTGRTRRVTQYIKEKLGEQGFRVDVYEVRHTREYARMFLHLNPRLILETLSSREIEIEVVPSFDPRSFDIVAIGSPIWYERVVPAIKTFVSRYRNMLTQPVACFTTSTLRRDYASGFRSLLESLGYRVIDCVSIHDPDRGREVVEKLVTEIVDYLKTRR